MTNMLRELEAVVGLLDAVDGKDGLVLEKMQMLSSAGLFIHAHHAEIAEAVADASRYRWLRANACDGFMRADDRSLNCDETESELDTWIDAAQCNSAREDGE